jgi:hypothetical protein
VGPAEWGIRRAAENHAQNEHADPVKLNSDAYARSTLPCGRPALPAGATRWRWPFRPDNLRLEALPPLPQGTEEAKRVKACTLATMFGPGRPALGDCCSGCGWQLARPTHFSSQAFFAITSNPDSGAPTRLGHRLLRLNDFVPRGSDGEVQSRQQVSHHDQIKQRIPFGPDGCREFVCLQHDRNRCHQFSWVTAGDYLRVT